MRPVIAALTVTAALHDIILRRFASTGADQHAWSLLILAALESSEILAGCLAGTQSPTAPKRTRKTSATTDATPAIEPPGVQGELHNGSSGNRVGDVGSC